MYIRKDSFYKKAKREGYRSRAAYKLMEINDKHKILKNGYCVADIGCFPGGWAQVAGELIGAKGIVVGVDVKKTQPIAGENFIFIEGDFTFPDVRQKISSSAGKLFDIILSDISPDLSGIKIRDQALSVELCRSVLEFAGQFLKNGGTLLLKIFQGSDVKDFLDELRNCFKDVKILKPSSSRKESGEVYILCSGKK